MSLTSTDLTDAAVLRYKLTRWDNELLKENDYSRADYDKARSAYQQLSSTSKAETKAAHQEKYLVQRRLLLAKLLELRAAAGQAMNQDLCAQP